jgi:hypothetical protein
LPQRIRYRRTGDDAVTPRVEGPGAPLDVINIARNKTRFPVLPIANYSR